MASISLPQVFGIPPEEWEPNYYRLLGLQVGEPDLQAIEDRVLHFMEKLRQFQLTHPEMATSGMNLLATAIDCLTDPSKRDDYHAKIGLKIIVEAIPYQSIADLPQIPALDSPTDSEVVLVEENWEVEQDDEDSILDLPPFSKADNLIPLEPAVRISDQLKTSEKPKKAPTVQVFQSTRKQKRITETRTDHRYRRKVALRRALQLWNRLWDHFNVQTSINLESPGKTISFAAALESISANRDRLLELLPTNLGRIVLGLAAQTNPLEVIKSFQDKQLESLIVDYHGAYYWLESQFKQEKLRLHEKTNTGLHIRILIFVRTHTQRILVAIWLVFVFFCILLAMYRSG